LDGGELTLAPREEQAPGALDLSAGWRDDDSAEYAALAPAFGKAAG